MSVMLTYTFICGVGIVLGIYLPLKLGNVMDAAIEKDYTGVIRLLVQIFLLFLASSILNYIKSLTSLTITVRMSEEIKNKIVSKVMIMPMKNIDSLENGQIVSKLGDAEVLTGFFMSVLNNLVINVIAMIVTAVVIFRISPLLAVVHYVNVPVLIIVYKLFGRIIKDKEKVLAENRDNMNSFIIEMLQGIREIRTMGGGINVLNKFWAIHRDYADKQYEKGRASIVFGSFNTILSGITQVVFLLVACMEIIQGNLSLGLYYAFNNYAGWFSNALSVLVNMGTEIQSVSVSVDRILQYCEQCKNREREKDKVSLSTIQSIRVDKVRFGYDHRMQVLQGISFEFYKNSLYVIVGSNGCGKSTFLDLIMNFYEPSEGKIYLNDIDVNQIKEECLFSKIAYIQQKPFFFNRSIVDNMRMIDDQISLEEIKNVCELVGMNEYIERLSQGYDTVLGETGSHFSGGQLHRLALARSLIQDADVYLLDELTADLDGENEKLIMSILVQLVQNGKIVILVSHRLSTIIKANMIIVMEQGRVITSGKHDALVNNSEVYQKLL